MYIFADQFCIFIWVVTIVFMSTDVVGGRGLEDIMIIISRDKATKDFSHMKQIKNEHGVVLRDLDMIIGRWKGYFDKLLNEENPRSIFDDGVPNEGLTQGISRDEVKVAISRMKNGKATGMDGIPVEVWKCLGEEGIDMLWDLMQGIYEQEKIPTEWRDYTYL